MKEVIKDVLDLKVPTLVYETLDEAVAASNKETVLARLLDYLTFHGSNGDARSLIVDVVTEVTKEKPLETPTGKNNADGSPIMQVSETDGKFVARALALHPEDKEAIQELVTERARGYKDAAGEDIEPIQVSVKAREPRSSKPKKLPGDYLATAQACLAKGNQDKLVALIKRDLQENVVLTGDQTKDADTLGWAIRKHKLWKDKQQLGEYANAMS